MSAPIKKLNPVEEDYNRNTVRTGAVESTEVPADAELAESEVEDEDVQEITVQTSVVVVSSSSNSRGR